MPAQDFNDFQLYAQSGDGSYDETDQINDEQQSVADHPMRLAIVKENVAISGNESLPQNASLTSYIKLIGILFQ